MSRFICSFFSEKSGSFTDTFCEIFCSKKSRNFILDTIGNYFDLTKNPRAIENSRVKPKKLAFFHVVFYNFKWQSKK